MSNWTIKLVVPIGIMLLLNALVPLTANALLLKNSGSEGLFLPVPGQLITKSHSINSLSSNIQNRPIPSSNSVQFSPTSNPNIHNGSNSYYYNNSNSWAKKTPDDSWNPLLAISPFLNVPKNLIVPECPQNSLVNSTISSSNSTNGQRCQNIIGTQRGDIIIATAVNNARILGLGGNDIIECGLGNCKVYTAFGNNVLMSGAAFSAQLYGGSGGYFRPGNNIFIGGGGETLMVGGNGNDQFYAGSNNLFDGGGDIMIGGSGANYFDCGPNGNGVILDFNPAKGDSKSPDCKYVITGPFSNIFGPGLPNIFGGLAHNLRDFNANQANNTSAVNTSNATSVVKAHVRVPSSSLHCCS